MSLFSVDDYKSFKTVTVDELEQYPGYDVLSVVSSYKNGEYSGSSRTLCIIGLRKPQKDALQQFNEMTLEQNSESRS
jgi:hypothetical protein